MKNAHKLSSEPTQEELWEAFQRAHEAYALDGSFKNFLARLDAHAAWKREFLRSA